MYYEVEAENREELDKMLKNDCVENIGLCVDEDPSDFYEENVVDIREV